MTLGIEHVGSKKTVTGRINFPTVHLEEDKVTTRKGTISDITGVIESLGLDSSGDIIFNGTDKVAVQKINANRPPDYSPTSRVVLKITRDADYGLHPLVVSGYSNDKNSRGLARLHWKSQRDFIDKFL